MAERSFREKSARGNGAAAVHDSDYHRSFRRSAEWNRIYRASLPTQSGDRVLRRGNVRDCDSLFVFRSTNGQGVRGRGDFSSVFSAHAGGDLSTRAVLKGIRQDLND